MPPLVSIGFALRNSVARYGRGQLELVVQSLRHQTYPHLEILVGDNGSTDGTSELCAALARQDSRVRVVRHAPPLTAQANFIYLFREAAGKYFTWMADDDFRTPNFIEVLVDALERQPEAGLAFPDQIEFSDHATYQRGVPVTRRFVTAGLSVNQRLRQMPLGSCTHVCYGLIRRTVLAKYPWYELENSSFDVPMGYYLSLRTEMIHVPGACYYRYMPPGGKSVEERARVNNFGHPRAFFPERMAWSCCQAAADALRERGMATSAWRLLPLVYRTQLIGWKGMVFRWSPSWARWAWRNHEARARRASLSAPSASKGV